MEWDGRYEKITSDGRVAGITRGPTTQRATARRVRRGGRRRAAVIWEWDGTRWGPSQHRHGLDAQRGEARDGHGRKVSVLYGGRPLDTWTGTDGCDRVNASGQVRSHFGWPKTRTRADVLFGGYDGAETSTDTGSSRLGVGLVDRAVRAQRHLVRITSRWNRRAASHSANAAIAARTTPMPSASAGPRTMIPAS